jgi:hypothetical protein
LLRAEPRVLEEPVGRVAETPLGRQRDPQDIAWSSADR